MGGQITALISLVLGQLEAGVPDAGAAADAAGAAAADALARAADAGVTDAARAATDAGLTDAARATDAGLTDAAAALTDAATTAATDAARATADALVDAGIQAFDASRFVAETPPAEPWIEYIVYGIIAVLILFFLIRGLRTPPTGDATTDKHTVQPALPEHDRTPAQIEAEARRAFGITEAVVPEEGDARVRLRVRPAPQKPPPAAPPGRDPSGKPAPGKPAADRRAPAEPTPPRVEPVEAAGKTLREGLARTHEGFVKKLGKIFGGAKTIDDNLLGDLEEALFTADIGVRTSQKLVDLVHESLGKKDLQSPARVWAEVKGRIRDILRVDAPPLDLTRARPLVIMVVGVNGAGKTTSIGKLAKKYSDEGKKVLLAAGDTFRAAAVEQLEVWGERAGVQIVKGQSGQDPASVIFEAIKQAEREGYDICIADTAGRLQARRELMDELSKIHRTAGRALDGAPHEVWLVLDATNGQNAISQAQVFTEAVDVTGLVLTKLDGTAKGGVVIGISDEMQLPVRYIGIGEKVADLRAFDPDAFAEALFADS